MKPRRLLVNDAPNQLGERTFWNDLESWFDMESVYAPFDELGGVVDAVAVAGGHTLIVRNASWFGPLKASATVPTISLLQDIFVEGPQRKMQEAVIKSSRAVVFNSAFTQSKYGVIGSSPTTLHTIPLPVDFSVFEPGNAMGLQQALSLPDGCVCWIGASQGAAGHVKGFDIFVRVVRANPQIPFVAVFKDAAPPSLPPNVRPFVRLPHEDLAKLIGACRVGLCTSRTESQHLAGIEMGACGLPLVVPNVGTYWNRKDIPGFVVSDPTPENFGVTVRAALVGEPVAPETIRNYWRKEFDGPVVRAAWAKLIEEVESHE